MPSDRLAADQPMTLPSSAEEPRRVQPLVENTSPNIYELSTTAPLVPHILSPVTAMLECYFSELERP